jgi:glycosyltransferase involved in cell wall biosynthesis
MATPKVILISEFPLPYSKIGSWSTLYNNCLSQENRIDYLVCEQPEYFFKKVNYQIVKQNFWTKFYKKITKKRHQPFIKALDKIVDKDEKYILQIIDNSGFLSALEDYFKKKGNRKQFYIQYFYHGYVPVFEKYSQEKFYKKIDELIVLTEKARIKIKENNISLPNTISYLHNGVDTAKFFALSELEKESLKTEMNVSGKKIFVWCSQDRPKKGLKIILDLWGNKYKNNSDYVLLVIGCQPREQKIDGVLFLGKIKNDLLSKYYQIADVYLFPTLCEEGFGMSLIEAMHCGCYCIASAYGGVPEVLQYGKLGKLIEHPEDIKNWEIAIENYVNGNAKKTAIPKNLYTSVTWNKEMDRIIIDAKNRFNE